MCETIAAGARNYNASTWLWPADHSHLDFAHWHVDQPNVTEEDVCVQLLADYSYTWVVTSCYSSAGFICEFGVYYTIRFLSASTAFLMVIIMQALVSTSHQPVCHQQPVSRQPVCHQQPVSRQTFRQGNFDNGAGDMFWKH